MSFVFLGGEEGSLAWEETGQKAPRLEQRVFPVSHPQSLALLRPGWIQSHAIPFHREKEKQREMQRKRDVKEDNKDK